MSKISLGQIDLLALQQYLEVVVGFRRKDDKAIDVSQVGTYQHPTVDTTDNPKETQVSPVLAHQVAMAVLDKDGLPTAITDESGAIIIPERNTVMNSLKLGGIDASEYLQRVESGTILADVNDATYNISTDIRNLKDELYQLKNQLIKTGTIKDSAVYNGFIDSFMENNQKHLASTGIMVDTISGNTILVQGSVDNLNINDIIVLENNGKFNIQKIKELNSYNRTRGGNAEIIVYSSDSSDDDYWEGATGRPDAHQGSFIQKSLGISKGGKFLFGCKPEDEIVETYDMQYIVKDGVDRCSVFELNHHGHGYGTEITIPASLESHVINKVQVSLAITGTPGGAVRGKFYNFNAGNVDFNISPAGQTAAISTTDISHGFNNITMDLIVPMQVNPGEKYLFILQTEGAGFNDENTLNIGGFVEDNCLDEVHNDSYIVENITNIGGVGNTERLYKAYNESDMFLILGTRKLERSEVQKLAYGLYSCEFDMYFSKANRIRVELLVNREGMFKVGTADEIVNNLAKGKTTEIPLVTSSGKVIKDDVFGRYEPVVVGKNTFEVYSFKTNNSNIVPAQDVIIAPKADVYRVGYEVQAIAKFKDKNGEERIDDFKLDFVGVVPGRDTLRPHESSDRLIFECDFQFDRLEDTIKLDSCHHIQVQVLWHSNVDANILQANEELEGAIFDIVVSTDQAYTQDPSPRD